jgi:hypothetical protein
MKGIMKEIIKDGWDVFPKWLWVMNGVVMTMALLVILFV